MSHHALKVVQLDHAFDTMAILRPIHADVDDDQTFVPIFLEKGLDAANFKSALL